MMEMSHVQPSQRVSMTDINHVSLIVSGGTKTLCTVIQVSKNLKILESLQLFFVNCTCCLVPGKRQS